MEMSEMAKELDTLQLDEMLCKKQLESFKLEFERSRFTYEHIMKAGQCFYMTGLTENLTFCLTVWSHISAG